MIVGAHSIIYSKEPAADRAFLKGEITCSAVQNQGWGLLTKVTLPGGGTLGVYQPRHARPKPSSRARRVYAALLSVGWQLKRQSGSHRTL
jgi:hypothetical protein